LWSILFALVLLVTILKVCKAEQWLSCILAEV
jgi:hypothetical protein